MKSIKMSLYIIGLCSIVYSCSKSDTPKPDYSAMINFVNAIPNGPSVNLKVSDEGKSFLANSLVNVTYFISLNSNGNSLAVPVSKKMLVEVKPGDNDQKVLFNRVLTFNQGDICTLFLFGNSNQPDTMLLKERFTNYQDSVAGIRFINLSSDTGPISVNILGKPMGSEVSGLKYGERTVFKEYKALASTPAYTFEFRDQTGNLLGSYNFSKTTTSRFLPRFFNATLLLRGLKNGSPGLEIAKVNHY